MRTTLLSTSLSFPLSPLTIFLCIIPSLPSPPCALPCPTPLFKPLLPVLSCLAETAQMSASVATRSTLLRWCDMLLLDRCRTGDLVDDDGAAAVVVDCLTGTMSSVKLLCGSTRWLRRNHLWLCLWLSCLCPISLWLSLSKDCDKFVSTEGAINNQLGCPSAAFAAFAAFASSWWQQWRRFQIASSAEQSSKANSIALRTPTWPCSWSWSSCRLSSSAWLPSRTCWAHWGRLPIDIGEAHSDPKTTRLSFQIGCRFSVFGFRFRFCFCFLAFSFDFYFCC